MNYIRHLNAFFSTIRKDNRLTSSHVSLYLALFQYWNFNRFQNPFPVYRRNIMDLSRIGSKNTYHKCIKHLHGTGYVIYQASTIKYKPAFISIIRLDTPKNTPSYNQLELSFPAVTAHVIEAAPDMARGSEAKQPVSNLTPASPNSDTTPIPQLGQLIKPNILKKRESYAKASPSHPTQFEIEQYFKEKNYSLAEAQKFFSHYKALDWKIQGKAPIINWQSLADKWMINAKNWNNESPHSVEEDLEKVHNIESLNQLFRQGKKIFHLITPHHFDELGLNLNEEVLNRARTLRINQLTGTNENSLIQIMKNYLSPNPDLTILQKDREMLENQAKKIAVINYLEGKLELTRQNYLI